MINIRILCIVMMNETIPNTDEELFLKKVSKEWRIHTYTDVIVSGQTKNNITNGWFRSIISFIILYLTVSTPTIKEDFISNDSTNYWFCWNLLVSTSAILITIIWYHSNYFYNFQVTTFTIFKFILITTEKSCIWFVFIIYGCLYFIKIFLLWIFFCISFNSSSEGVNDRADFTFDVSVIHRSLLPSSILISFLFLLLQYAMNFLHLFQMWFHTSLIAITYLCTAPSISSSDNDTCWGEHNISDGLFLISFNFLLFIISFAPFYHCFILAPSFFIPSSLPF